VWVIIFLGLVATTAWCISLTRPCLLSGIVGSLYVIAGLFMFWAFLRVTWRRSKFEESLISKEESLISSLGDA